MNNDYTYTPAEPVGIAPAAVESPPAQRRTGNPQLLLAAILFILLIMLAVLIYDRYFSQQARAQTTTEQVAPAGDNGIPKGRVNAVRVEDGHCAGGYGWQWLESVPDGRGTENDVIVGSCKEVR